MRPSSRLGGGLVGSFALASFIVFAVIGAALHVLISRESERQAQDDARTHAELITKAVLEAELTPEDIAEPVTGARYTELLDVVRSRVLIGDAVRLKIWRPDGTVMFSDEPRLVGMRFPEEAAELSEVLDSGSQGGLSDLQADENVFERGLAKELLQTYVPLHVSSRTRPSAVAEVYQDYGPTALAVASSLKVFDAILASGLLLLYLLLLPVAGRAGRTLRSQTTDLERQRDELAVLLEERRELLAKLVRAQEEERARIAEDIHDDSIQAVTEVALRLEGLRRFVPDDAGQARLDTIDASLRGALERMRNLMFDLRPPALDEAGLVAAFESYLARAWGGLDLQHGVESRLDEEPPIETRTIAYRIGQEALANVRKHARATRADVLVENVNGGLRLVVTDDGVGLSGEPERRPDHLGVVSMRERAAVAGGWCRLTGSPGAGTTLEAWLPLPGRVAPNPSEPELAAASAQSEDSGRKP